MAKIDLDNDYDDLSFDDDEFSFDDGEPSGGGKDRKPRDKIVRTLKESADQKYRDSKYRRELLKAALPSEYSSVLDDYDTVSKEAGGIWREQQREWEKHRKEVKKMFKPYTDVLGGIPGLKRIAEWANVEERSRGADSGPTDEQQDELRIQSILSDTFGQMQEQNVKTEAARVAKDDESRAIEKSDRDAQIKQTIEGNQLLLSINNSTRSLSSYNEKINYPYQKRSLELQARQLITQQRMLQTMNSFRELAVKELQDIHKNTSLPDYLKITPAEMAQQSIANRLMNTVTAPFDGVGSKLANRVAGKVRGKLKDMWEFLGESVTSVNMQNEDFAEGGMGGGDGTAWGGLKHLLGGIAGDMVINKPAGLIRDKLAPKLRDLIEKRTGAKLFGSNLKSMGGQFSTLFNHALKTGNSGSKLMDAIINGLELGDAAITGSRQIHDTNQLQLEKAAYMDNRFKLSVTDVIPSWLKKIYGEMFSMNNNGAKADDVTWDFKSASFVKTSDKHDEMMDAFVDKDKVKAQVEAVNKWVDIIGQQALSSATRKWLEKWVLKQINGSDPINPLYLLSDEVSMPTAIREELAFVLPVTLGLNEKQRQLLAGGTMFDVLAATNKGSQSFHDKMNKASDAELVARSSTAVDYKKLDELGKTPEGRRFLLERGIAVNNNGSIEFNEGFSEQLYDQFEMFRKGNNGKKDRTYQRNQHVVFDGGDAELSDDIFDLDTDYDNPEARQRSDSFLNFKGMRMNGMGSFYDSSDTKARNAILKKVKGYKNPDSPYNQGWGTEYFIDRDGNIHTSAEKDFLQKRRKLRPDIDRKIKKGYASGGQIESFAKGGQTTGEPDQGRTVEMHGGEFVVSHDATKFNVQLLQAINKFGAPLVNADGTVNSVYHKLFGFKSAKEFNARAKAKGLTNKANDVKNEQFEIMLKNIISKLDMSTVSETDAKMLVNVKKSTESRLAKAMSLWSKQQKDQIKASPKLYAKQLGNRGIDILNGKFDQWLDSDGTGVNVEIKNKLLAGAKGSLKSGREAALAKLNDAKRLAKSALVDREGTLANVRSAIDNDVSNKAFAKPQDIYMEGMKSPILRRFAFSQRIYYDQKSGQVIKSPLDITGTVVNNKGDVILSNDDLLFSKFYTMDKGHVIPFKFLGAEDSNRKFATTKEYATDRLNIIKGSQRYKEMMQQAKDARDKYIMDKPVDVYLRGQPTAIMFAAKFKEGFYIDKNTGNVLWTHHDITGPVIDKDKNEVLSAEELADGLFDVDQKHLKISKIKQYRNMAFRRGAEVYNKYAAKHVNKFTGKAMDWASKMGEKTIGMNYDSKPIDVYVKGEDTPRITAQQFKQGIAFDVKSEKILKSHSGISGPVVNANDRLSMLIYEKDFATGLVDATGEPLHIPLMMSKGQRFKAYLMEAALPKKTFGKLKTFITMSPEKRAEMMNDKLAKAKIAYDVFVVGNPVTPVMTKAKFEAGEYVSVKTGKVIHIPEQIDGAILDSQGNQILSAEDFAKGLVTLDGKKIHMMGSGMFGSIKSSLEIGNRLKATLKTFAKPEAIVEAPTATETTKNQTYTIKFKMKKGQGLDPDLVKYNNRTFTDEDVKNGFLVELDFDGKKHKVDNVKNITAETWLLSKTSSKVSDGVSFLKVFTNNGGIFTEDGKFLKTAYHTGKKTVASKAKLAFGDRLKNVFGGAWDSIKDKFGFNEEREGSWLWQRKKKEKEGKDGKKVEEKKEKKDSWMGKLIKKLMFPLTGLFGMVASGLGVLKSSLLTGLAWLGKAVVTKSLGGGLGAALSGLMGGGGGKFGTIAKAALAGAAVYGGIKGYNYLDGNAGTQDGFSDADRNGANAGLDTTSKVLNMADAPEDKSNGGFLSTVLNNPLASAALTAAMFAPGTVLKGVGAVGKGLFKGGKFLGGKALGALGRGGASAAGGLAARAPGMLGTAGRVAGGVLSGAGKLGGLAKLATGVGGKALLSAGGMAFSALRLLTGPVGIGLTVAWYGGKALLKLWNNHKNPWNRFRMAQYGFNHNDKELMEKIAQIESASIPLVKISQDGKCTLASDEKAMNEVLRICGFKDDQGQDIPEQQARLSKFAQWYKYRFVRVYASYLRTLKRLKGKAEMIDLQTLNRQEQEILLKDVHFTSMTDTPYVVTASPFEDPAETERDVKDVDVIARKLRNKIEQLPKAKNYKAPDDYSDGLNDKTAKDPAKDASKEDKTKAAMDKDLDKEKLPTTLEDPKTAIDKANQAVTYQAKASDVITKTHNESIRAATVTATKETDNIFSRAMDGLQSKVANYFTSLSVGLKKIMNGEILDGAGDILGSGIGGTIYAGAQKLGDFIGGSDSGAEANLIKLAKQAGITDPTELAMLLGQCSIESQGFTRSREVGADSYFARYEGKKSLGNTQTGDGARFKGRGWIQLTGRANYEAFKKWSGVDVVSNPELLEKEPYASMAAIYYWTKHPNMNKGRAAAQKGDVTGVTAAIRGSAKGKEAHLDKRKAAFDKYMQTVGKDGGAALMAKAGASAPASPSTNAPTARAAGEGATGSNTPNMVMAPNAQNKQAGGLVGGAMATLDAKYGGKATPAAPAAQAQPKYVGAKYFIGDSIAHGYKTHHKGEGWTKVGASPSTVLFYIRQTLTRNPTGYKGRDIYISTGLSNNPTDIVSCATQLRELKLAGLKVKVFGVSNKYPKGNPVGLNASLASLCKTYGMTFLGGFEPGKDNVHPASWSKLPSGGGAPATPATTKAQAKASATDKVTTMATNTAKTPTGAAAATQQQQTPVTNNGGADWDFSKIAKAAIKGALPKSKGQCGAYTRKALIAGDLKNKISKMGTLGASAYMFVESLPKIGFNVVFKGKKFGNFVPQIGDVAVFGRGIYGASNKSGGGWVHGHACVYTGAKWVSDFVQQTVYPSSSYSANGLQMTIFRANGIAPAGGFDAEANESQVEAGTPDNQVNNSMTNISNGTASPTGVHAGGSITGDGGNAADYGTVNNILTKQLNVQREMLQVLKTIAGNGGMNNSNNTNGTNQNDPNGIQTTINGVPVDAQGNPINQQTPQGMTLPNMDALGQQNKPAPKSPFEGIKHPISVTKPV